MENVHFFMVADPAYTPSGRRYVRVELDGWLIQTLIKAIEATRVGGGHGRGLPFSPMFQCFVLPVRPLWEHPPSDHKRKLPPFLEAALLEAWSPFQGLGVSYRLDREMPYIDWSEQSVDGCLLRVSRNACWFVIQQGEGFEARRWQTMPILYEELIEARDRSGR